MKALRIFLLFVFVSSAAYATDPDTNYVQTFKNIFAIKTFIQNNGFIYTLCPQNNPTFTEQQLNDAKIYYSPHIPPVMGVALNIKGIGFSYIFKFTNDYLDTTGLIKAGYKGFTMNIYKPKFGFEAYYQDYQRFYFHYKGDNILSKNYNTDIRAYQFGANAILLFNGKKFSYNAAFSQSQLQKKTAGSALLSFSLRFSELKSGQLFPDSVKAFYDDMAWLNRNRNYAFFLQYGYGFNITKKYFYFAGLTMVGLGIQSQTYRYLYGAEQRMKYRLSCPLIGRAKVSMGYNGKIIFTGLFANAEAAQSQIKPLKTQQLQYSYGFYLGFRAIKFTKTKGQLKAEAKRKKQAESAAKKKAADDKKAAAKAAKEAKRKKK